MKALLDGLSARPASGHRDLDRLLDRLLDCAIPFEAAKPRHLGAMRGDGAARLNKGIAGSKMQIPSSRGEANIGDFPQA